MRIFPSRRICLLCSRSLPRATSRCPWCIASMARSCGVCGPAGAPPPPVPAVRLVTGAAVSQICDERPGVAFRPDVIPIVAPLPESLVVRLLDPEVTAQVHSFFRRRPREDRHEVVSELVNEQDVLLGMQADRKRAALGGIAVRIAESVGRSHGAVLAAFLRREQLGPTAVGNGIAIPHARLEGISAPAAVLATLQRPVAFGTPDDASVDLLLALLWPTSDMKGFVPTLLGVKRHFAEHWASRSAPAIPDASRGARLAANLRGSVAGVAVDEASDT